MTVKPCGKPCSVLLVYLYSQVQHILKYIFQAVLRLSLANFSGLPFIYGLPCVALVRTGGQASLVDQA